MNHEQLKKILLNDRKFKAEYENKSDVSYEIAKSVRQLRIKHGLTQEKLAKLLKTKQASIARIENPASPMPSLRFLKEIAMAFKTELIPPKFLALENNDKVIYNYIDVPFFRDFDDKLNQNNREADITINITSETSIIDNLK